MRTEDIAHRGVLLPRRRAHREGRHVHQHPADGAVAPQGRRAARRPALGPVVHLPPRPAASASGWPAPTTSVDRPVLDLTWDYPTEGAHDEPSAEAVLAEINGCDADGELLSAYTQLKRRRLDRVRLLDLLRRATPTASTRPPGGRRAREQNWTGAEWAWAWPANRRILYNRASADPEGQPVVASARRSSGGTPSRGAGPATTRPTSRPTSRPTTARRRARRARRRSPATDPFIMQADGRGWLFAPAGVADGPLPTHYEPQDSPVPQPAAPPASATRRVRSTSTRTTAITPIPDEPGARRVPVRGHHLPADRALHRRRHEPLDAVPGRAAAGVLLRGLTRAGRRARPRARRLGDARHAPAG